MTRAEYLKFVQEFHAKQLQVTAAKNHDYAGHGNDDPFANFRMVEQMGFLSTEEGFITRMMDKMSRLMTFIRKGKLVVENEGAQDALMDLSTYCILLSGYLKDKGRKEAKKEILGEVNKFFQKLEWPQEGDDYYTVEEASDGAYTIIKSCWDDQSEELQKEDPDRKIFQTREEANSYISELVEEERV